MTSRCLSATASRFTTATIAPSSGRAWLRRTSKRYICQCTSGFSASVSASASPAPGSASNGKKSEGPKKQNERFQRVKAEDVTFRDDRLRDNSFEGIGLSANDFGARAAKDLIVTRGKAFTKEKNKKKRGSYRGGEITMKSNSIKFD